jgi:6-phosphofructokinase 2
VRQAKTFGAEMVLDTSGPALKAALAEGVTLIKPNLGEFTEFVGHPLPRDQDRIAACRKLVADKRVEAVALTLGSDGALLVTAGGAWRAEPLRVEVVSAVGAGDSFLGGMVAALAKGERLEHAFRVGLAAGAAAVMMPGTELCREEDVRRLLGEVRISEVAQAPA